DWERWSAELMESHLSYPVLCYFRSQHDNQSWLAALTTILDTSALTMSSCDGAASRQAQWTFAMARHAVVDLAQVFNIPPQVPHPDRMAPATLTHLHEALTANGICRQSVSTLDQDLTRLRKMYEPYVYSLSEFLLMRLPPWAPTQNRLDNWQ